jgi:hypothetical protein
MMQPRKVKGAWRKERAQRPRLVTMKSANLKSCRVARIDGVGSRRVFRVRIKHAEYRLKEKEVIQFRVSTKWSLMDFGQIPDEVRSGSSYGKPLRLGSCEYILCPNI